VLVEQVIGRRAGDRTYVKPGGRGGGVGDETYVTLDHMGVVEE
jgi:hypothetical protein